MSNLTSVPVAKENLELKTTISKMQAQLKSTESKVYDRPDCKLTIENFLSNKVEIRISFLL